MRSTTSPASENSRSRLDPDILGAPFGHAAVRIAECIEIESGPKKDRSDQKKYEAWFAQVSTTISGSTALDRMAAMAFRGELGDVVTLGGPVPRMA